MYISYELPLEYYDGNNRASNDYTYCYADKYLLYPEYRKFINTARHVLIDSKNVDRYLYKDILKELGVTRHIPVGDTLEEQLDFSKSLNNEHSIPYVRLHGSTMYDMYSDAIKIYNLFGQHCIIMVPATEEGLKNTRDEAGYFNATDIDYEPLRMALNRKILMKDLLNRLPDVYFHLDGCLSLSEFLPWGDNMQSYRICSLNTSHPVDMTVTGCCNKYNWGFFTHNGKKHPMIEYCPENVPYYFADDFTALKNSDIHRASFDTDLRNNIDYFTSIVKKEY